jgi:hypothetical protein
MNDDEKFQIYTPDTTYVKGWYDIEELQEILATMRRIKRANNGITEDFTQQETSG